MLRRLPEMLVLLGACLLLTVSSLSAQQIPPPLRDWQDWVLHQVPQHACPFLANRMPDSNSYQCAWPGRLSLTAGPDGGHFVFAVHVDAPSWVALPGGIRHWPQQVSADNRPAPVLQRGNQPMLWLTQGDYQLKGVLPWTSRPARVQVPAAIGLVTLSVDGKRVAHLERNGDQLTLGEAMAAQRTADSLSLRVYRRLDDGLPAILQTQLQLNVTGTAREQVLGPVLPAGFVATALSGGLPARLGSDGRLRLQLRPGRWVVTLEARASQPLAAVTLKLPAEPWPRREIWSYADDPGLRSTRVQGQPVDPAQAGVPQGWRELPAYALDDSAGLAIVTGTRGDEGGRGDQVRLQRQLWLDFDGRGLGVADHLVGTLRHQQRLEVVAPWQLQRASQNDQPLLISKVKDGRAGVELRQQQLNLHAGLRLAGHAGALPASGWQIPLEGIDATLHLPYGYRLLGAIGADRSPDSWVARWSLLDLFVVAVIALLAGRLLGWPWGLLLAAFLALAQQEAGAPRWTLALVLVLTLLMRGLPQGRLQLAARIGAVAMFALTVLWTLPFAATQLQYALHPQLEGMARGRVVQADYRRQEVSNDNYANAPAKQPSPKIMRQGTLSPVQEASLNAVQAPPPPAPMASAARVLDSIGVTAARSPASLRVAYEQGNPDLIQAGGGMPQWDLGNDYRLGWSGPVSTHQTSRLVIAPAWLVRLLRVLMVALLASLLGRLLPLLLTARRLHWRGWHGGAASTALLVLALLPWGVHAQSLPSPQLLEQLRSRLTEAPKCAPTCAAIPQAMLQVSGDILSVNLEAHAGAVVAFPLPQPDSALQLLDVSVDGHVSEPLVRLGGQLLLRLERGVHKVDLRYRVGATDSANLHFMLHPERVAFSGTGWSAGGLDAGRLLGDSVALNRIQTRASGAALPTAQSFPPYVRLTRNLVLGVDWTVENVVRRVAPRDGGFSLTLPLLPGEHPLGEDALVRDGRISITFNANSSVVRWTSRLDHAAALALKAPALGKRAEVWEVHAAPMWHVQAQGVPISASDNGLLYQPLPGETLHLAFSEPIAVAGDSLAFDGVQMISQVGKRAVETALNLQARSTRGGEHLITLPAGAELLQASRDGESINLAVRHGKLGLPLLPGAHTYALSLRESGGVSTRTHTPSLALDAPAANIQMGLQLPHDRWVLWTWGPGVGPAVLYWSQLVVLLLVAWLLGRYAPTPLRFRHWLLLGLGFSAFAWSAYALVVLWLILLGLRARSDVSATLSPAKFNSLQMGLAALTLLALTVLIAAVPKGLLGLPDMHVAGNGSGAWNLRWFVDQSAGVLPHGGVLSVSLWVYKLAMLAWALWLANALIGWLRWGFAAWTHGGYWHPREKKPGISPSPLPPSSDGSPGDA